MNNNPSNTYRAKHNFISLLVVLAMALTAVSVTQSYLLMVRGDHFEATNQCEAGHSKVFGKCFADDHNIRFEEVSQ